MSKARDIASATPVPTAVSATELGYLDGVTSAVQTQITSALSVANSKTEIVKGTTAVRPTGSTGDLYYDTTLENLYQKTASSGWKIAGVSGIPSPSTADILMVGGGGGSCGAGGGAGAGGITYSSNTSISGTYTLTVGAGGTATGTTNAAPGNGGSTQFTGLTTALGGGFGGGFTGSAYINAGSGSSGGGAGFYTGITAGTGTAGQGNNGGNANQGTGGGDPRAGGGGGGFSAAGGNASPNVAGNGGVGTSTYSAWGAATSSGQNVSGTYFYAGGGGGNAQTLGVGGNGGGTNGTGSSNLNVVPAAANTGGGAGSGISAASSYGGANGGSGVIIMRYADNFADLTAIAAGLSYTKYTSGGYKWYKFTAGTGTVTI